MNNKNPAAFLLLVLLLPPGIGSTEKGTLTLTVEKGQSVTIPCFYRTCSTCSKQLCRENKTFYCHQKSVRSWRNIEDDPTQGVFTVPLKNLQEGDSGMYMCLLHHSGLFKKPELVYNIRVTSDTPGLSVKDNTVEAELGGSVTVLCFYSDVYSKREKGWCRAGMRGSCVKTRSTEASSGRATLKVDPTAGVFRVTLRDLEKEDTGWYWCSAGDLKFPFHIKVSEKRSSK
ncbi:hypothetical protein GN956_G26145 [Arapaima gigas]